MTTYEARIAFSSGALLLNWFATEQGARQWADSFVGEGFLVEVCEIVDDDRQSRQLLQRPGSEVTE